MKKFKSVKIITTIIGITLLMATSPLMAKSTSAQAIEQVIRQYEHALNTSDAQAIIKLYGKEPIFMPQHSTAQNGRAAVKKAYESVFNTIDLNITFTIYEIEVFGNTAWVRTSSAGKTIILANKMKINEGNNELFIFKKENNNWKIHRYLFSTTTPRQ